MKKQNDKIGKKRMHESEKTSRETERMLDNPAMAKRIEESRKQIVDGKGVKIELDDLWK